MFKKKNNTTTSERRPPVGYLPTVINKLQMNAEKVERNIIETEQNLNKDIKKINEGRQPLYQEHTNKTILNSLELLNTLDEDAAEASRLQHPQSEMIEKDMKQLRVRVMKLREEHDRIDNAVNLGKMINEKLTSVNNKGFGHDLITIENDVEQHNIFQSEVEALASYITGDRDGFDDQQVKYNKLLVRSTEHQKNLLSLRDYMLRCNNELCGMEKQAEELIAYDWSDNNLDYLPRKRQYEDCISKCLESNQKTLTRLNEDGEKLIEQNHPAKNIIGAQMDAVQAYWKEFLNLLICEENHLKNMDDYHKFHKDARDSNSMLKLLETKVNQKYNPEFKDMYQMEGMIADLDAKAIDQFNERLKALQKHSLQVLPLKYRRETPNKLFKIEALCDYETNEGSILRGEWYTLLRNNGLKWDVKDAAGRTMNVPGVCFIIPPIDPEAVAIVDNLLNLYKVIRQNVASSKSALKARLAELKKESTGDEEEQQCHQRMAGLDKVVDSDWEVKRPSEDTTDANTKYSVSSSEGQHECSETGLRWRSDTDVSLEYQFVEWTSLSKDILKNYTPCGPLIDITVTSGTLEEIQLPHFVCVDSVSSSDDAVKAIYVKDGTVSLERCELSGSHAKLLNPIVALLGVVANPCHPPPKCHCETLIYRNRIASLNLHVYLIVKDPKLKKDVEKKEKNNVEIVKPTPDEGLTMDDSYTLKTSCDSEIKPPSLTLTRCKANFFDLYIQDAKKRLELSIETKEAKKIWDVNIESEEFNINSSASNHDELPQSASAPPSLYGNLALPLTNLGTSGLISDDCRQTTSSPVNRSLQNSPWWLRLLEALEHATFKTSLRQSRGAEFVEKHRTELISRVSLVEPIADDMKPLIGEEKYQIILNSGTRQAQMRALLDFLTTSKLKDKLYQSLVKHERFLVEDLEDCV